MKNAIRKTVNLVIKLENGEFATINLPQAAVDVIEAKKGKIKLLKLERI